MFSWSLLLVMIRQVAAKRGNISAPISIPPSQLFSGDDGLWSTFLIEVGSPPQTVALLPGTSAFAGTTIWVVLSEGCWEANPDLPGCASARGGVFTRNLSTSWSTQRLPNGGLAQLNTLEEGFLGVNATGAAYYGFDTVKLGISGQNLPVLQNQLIAGIATDNYFVGSLGLSPVSFNISDLNNPLPSVLGILRNESIVPSSSWGYTAGSAYSEPQVYGSLVFGGYDKARVGAALYDVPFSGDTSRDLQVQLQAITYNTIGSVPLLADTIHIFIDSMVSQIWLPLTVCERFEQAFNLTWNAAHQQYLVDDDVHTALAEQNPVFSFTIGSPDADAGTVNIALPYAAFDLNTTLPIGSSRYFPLQRAQNSTQYVLGRTFLQEAYIFADYDRQNFSISQAVPPLSSASEQIIPICAPGEEHLCRQDHAKLNGGEIAGIAVGSTGAVLAVLAVMFCLRRRRRSDGAALAAPIAFDTEHKSNVKQAEPFLTHGAELEDIEAPLYELDRMNELRPELAGDTKLGRHIKHDSHELGTQEVAAYELEAPVR
ncbi:hypothetical protein LTR15_003533 [Elasticomyces elasticus]|nr:hypothetical protein LTR15_003533 [Elasticomyces elasticus]